MPKLINLLSYDIAEDIEKYIFESNLPPGSKIPSERELAQKYNVTRVTLRNGLQRLIDQGIIYNIPNSGYFVSERKITREAANYFFPKSDPRLRDIAYSTIPLESFNVATKLLRLTTSNLGMVNIAKREFLEKANDKIVSFTYTLQSKDCLERYPNLFNIKEKPENILQRQKIRIYHADDKEMELLNVTANDSLFLVSELISDENGLLAACESICVGTRCQLQSKISI